MNTGTTCTPTCSGGEQGGRKGVVVLSSVHMCMSVCVSVDVCVSVCVHADVCVDVFVA
jgi:hypothetical protein